jgi:hypothetical protein
VARVYARAIEEIGAPMGEPMRSAVLLKRSLVRDGAEVLTCRSFFAPTSASFPTIAQLVPWHAELVHRQESSRRSATPRRRTRLSIAVRTDLRADQ